MSTVIESVVALAAKYSGFPPEKVAPHHAIYQDLGLIGNDMKAFIAALAVATTLVMEATSKIVSSVIASRSGVKARCP